MTMAVLVVSCNGSADPVSTTLPGGPTTTQPTPTTAAAPTTTSSVATTTTVVSDGPPLIFISGFAFHGPDTVPVGTTVTVENRDSVDHTWSSASNVFDSGNLADGATFEFTFSEAGEFPFFCEIHPTMTGTIKVEG